MTYILRAKGIDCIRWPVDNASQMNPILWALMKYSCKFNRITEMCFDYMQLNPTSDPFLSFRACVFFVQNQIRQIKENVEEILVWAARIARFAENQRYRVMKVAVFIPCLMLVFFFFVSNGYFSMAGWTIDLVFWIITSVANLKMQITLNLCCCHRNTATQLIHNKLLERGTS